MTQLLNSDSTILSCPQILQEFSVSPPIEAQYVRLVCTENAAEDDSHLPPSLHCHRGEDPLGFWEISFS